MKPRTTETTNTGGAAALRRRTALLFLLAVLSLLPLGATAQIRPASGLPSGRPSIGGSGNMTRSGSNASSSNTSNPNFPQDSTFGQSDSSAITGLQYHTETPDSVLRQRVFLFFYHPTEVKLYDVWNPTLDPTGVQFSDPLDALNGDYYLGKGMLGHPHVSLFPTPADGLDIQLQPDPNRGYAKRPTNIRFYQTMTPYTVLSYNSSLNKDYLVRVSHTQNIMPGWNASFDYRLIRPEGIYTSTSAKNHYLDATTNYFSRDSRLQALAGIIWQGFNIDENGGISDDSYFIEHTLNNRSGVPVNLYNMGTVHRELNVFGHATYNLVRQFETVRQRDSLVFRIENDTLTTIDTVDAYDTIRLNAPTPFNAGIIGLEANYDRRKRVFTDSTWWRETSATLFWTNDAYVDHRWQNPLKLTVGASIRQVSSAIEGDSLLMLSTFDPYARAVFSLGRATLSGEADLRSSFDADGQPDSRYSALISFNFDSARSTHAELMATIQRKSPDVRMIHDALIHQGVNLKKIVSNEYRLSFTHADIVDLDLRATNMSHNAWYDSSLYIYEGTDELWLYQARLTTHLNVGWMHLDMQHLLQFSTDSIQMPVPLWAVKGSLYADLKLFRGALRAQIGADVRYHTSFFAPGYDPYTGLFYHQDQVQIGDYIWADIFINLNVKRASFYAKAGHLNALWEQSPSYFILPHYPGQRFGFFWGITWHFFD